MYTRWLHTANPTKPAVDGKPHAVTLRLSRGAGEADSIMAEAWIDGQVMLETPLDIGKDRTWPRTGCFGVGNMNSKVVRYHSVRMWATEPVVEPVPEPVIVVDDGCCCVVQ